MASTGGRLARALATMAAVAALGTGLAACGGGDSDEETINDLIERAVIDSDAELCSENFTQAFVEETTGEKGDDAVAECEKQAGNVTTENTDLEVSDVEVDGDTATATATYKADGEEGSVDFEFGKEDGTWKFSGAQ